MINTWSVVSTGWKDIQINAGVSLRINMMNVHKKVKVINMIKSYAVPN